MSLVLAPQTAGVQCNIQSLIVAVVTAGFDVDGAVLKVDDLQQQARLGVDAARDPR
jgi:NAD-dependent DNA ligase